MLFGESLRFAPRGQDSASSGRFKIKLRAGGTGGACREDIAASDGALLFAPRGAIIVGVEQNTIRDQGRVRWR